MSINFDAFSSGQVGSKIWLVQNLERALEEHFPTDKQGYRIWILAGWYGITNFLLRTRGRIPILEVRSFDSDPECEPIADKINNLWVWAAWQFKAHTADVNELEYNIKPDVVINSSVEHIEDRTWFDRIPPKTFVCLQASSLAHDDHKNTFDDAHKLLEAYPLSECVYDGKKYFEYEDGTGFYRVMIMGWK